MIDTLKLKNALVKAGFTPESDEAVINLAAILDGRGRTVTDLTDYVTKEYLRAELAVMKRDLTYPQVGIVVVLGIVVIRLFFP